MLQGALGLIPDQGTRSHMLQLRVRIPLPVPPNKEVNNLKKKKPLMCKQITQGSR